MGLFWVENEMRGGRFSGSNKDQVGVFFEKLLFTWPKLVPKIPQSDLHLTLKIFISSHFYPKIYPFISSIHCEPRPITNRHFALTTTPTLYHYSTYANHYLYHGYSNHTINLFFQNSKSLFWNKI